MGTLVVSVLHEVTAHLILLWGYFAQETEFGNGLKVL